jgi:hypothetical protein
MDILLVSNSEFIKAQTRKIIAETEKLSILSFEVVKDKEILPYDIIIIGFDYCKVIAKEFKTILDVNCKITCPILALLENGSILDQFEVLALGALDSLILPTTDELYSQKLGQMYKWEWYYSRSKGNQ